MSEVFLIVPPYSYTEIIRVKGNIRKRGGFYVFYPHLGLLYLAAVLQKAGIDVSFSDMATEGISEEDLKPILVKERPKMVGVTVTTPTLPAAHKVIRGVRKILPSAKIIVGGAHISALPEATFQLGADFGFVGEAEVGFLTLCQQILTGKPRLSKIKGLVYQKKEKVFVNPHSFISDLDKIPYPARELSKIDSYFSPVLAGRITSMIASRGCPYVCIYCSRPAVEKHVRFRQPKKIVEEMKKVIEQFGVKYINFEDDTFTLNKKQVEDICREIKRQGLKVKWGCQTRADLVDKKLLKLMREAGCLKISFGVESGSEKIRFILGKKITDRQVQNAFNWANDMGIETNAFFMFGHPGETERDLEKTIQMAKSLSSTYAAFNLTTIYPASPLYQIALREDKIKPGVWEKYMRGKRKLVVYVPKDLTLGKLRKYQRQAFSSFYLRPQFFLDQIRRISSPADLWIKARVGLVVLQDFIFGE